MARLEVVVAGVTLRNPTLLASGFLGETGASLVRVWKAGAGGVVTKSISREPRLGYPNPTVFEADGSLLNAVGLPNPGIGAYEAECRSAVASGAPVVASVFGSTPDDYAAVAAAMEGYGAHAIEMNLSCPHVEGTGAEIAESEEAVRVYVQAVKAKTRLPVFAKLSPNVAAIAKYAAAAEDGGADGVTAINTVKAMAIAPELKMPVLAHGTGGLSGPAVKSVGVRCVYEIHAAVDVPILGVGGIATGRDALEYLMAGASAVQIGTAVMFRGLDVFAKVAAEIGSFLDAEGYGSVKEVVGVAHG